MTAQQCAERQAARDNLVRELCEALELANKVLEAIALEMTVGDRYTNAGQLLLDSLEPIRIALDRAKEQQ